MRIQEKVQREKGVNSATASRRERERCWKKVLSLLENHRPSSRQWKQQQMDRESEAVKESNEGRIREKNKGGGSEREMKNDV